MNFTPNNIDGAVILTPQEIFIDKTDKPHTTRYTDVRTADYLLLTHVTFYSENNNSLSTSKPKQKKESILFVVQNTHGTSMKNAINQVTDYFKARLEFINNLNNKNATGFIAKASWDIVEILHVTSGESLALTSQIRLNQKTQYDVKNNLV